MLAAPLVVAAAGASRDRRRLEELTESSKMRAVVRVLVDEAMRRGVNFSFAGAVLCLATS